MGACFISPRIVRTRQGKRYAKPIAGSRRCASRVGAATMTCIESRSMHWETRVLSASPNSAPTPTRVHQRSVPRGIFSISLPTESVALAASTSIACGSTQTDYRHPIGRSSHSAQRSTPRRTSSIRALQPKVSASTSQAIATHPIARMTSSQARRARCIASMRQMPKRRPSPPTGADSASSGRPCGHGFSCFFSSLSLHCFLHSSRRGSDSGATVSERWGYSRDVHSSRSSSTF
jgi:hypothetical protein